MKRVFLLALIVLGATMGVLLTYKPTAAAEPAGGLAVQVTPSPLVATVKPGETNSLEIKVRNTSPSPEKLTIEPRSFTVDSATGDIKINDATLPEIAEWISFSEPTFDIKAGEWKTIKVNIAVPKEAGFSYYFTLNIRRATDPKISSGRQLKGSVAIFTLINIDRPGATRKVELIDVSADQSVYEYLPATIKLRFKNTGNTILQPYGNLFLQRISTDKTPISTLPVNDQRGYLLPGTERLLTATWTDGFPVYETSTTNDGKTVKNLKWNIDKISHFRIGKYTAKVVAVYNDGTRDVPIEKVVTFWVIPWRAIGGLIIAIAALLLVGRFFIKRKTERAVRKALAKRDKQES
jgi:hypothetical protein